MDKNCQTYQAYVEILRQELVPAMGCTEPIAIAYGAAKARAALGALPDQITVAASGNIIKNVKSVIVPNTDGRKGIEVAAAIGALAGDPSAELEVIAHVRPESRATLGQYLADTKIQVRAAQSPHVLDITISVQKGLDTATVQIVNEHTNIVRITRNDKVLFEKEYIRKDGNPLFLRVIRLSLYRFVAYLSLKSTKRRFKLLEDKRHGTGTD